MFGKGKETFLLLLAMLIMQVKSATIQDKHDEPKVDSERNSAQYPRHGSPDINNSSRNNGTQLAEHITNGERSTNIPNLGPSDLEKDMEGTNNSDEPSSEWNKWTWKLFDRFKRTRLREPRSVKSGRSPAKKSPNNLGSPDMDNHHRDNENIKSCPSGKHGENCTLNCPENCAGDCNTTTGFCRGCNKTGHYGDRCELICFHCNNQSCYYFNGHCLEGTNMTYIRTNSSTEHTEIFDTVKHNITPLIVAVCLLSAIIIVQFLLPFFGVRCYPRESLIGSLRDHIERSRVRQQQENMPLSNNDVTVQTNGSVI